MFESNDLYTLLTSGRSEADIAESFTKALNDAANRKREEEVKAAEAERLAKAAMEEDAQRRITDLTEVLRNFVDYLEEYYPDLTKDQELDDEALTELAAAIILMLDMQGLTAQIKTLKPTPAPTPKKTDPDAIFADFFKSLGL